MKIIDLFYNVMVDGKVPQKIKYHNKIWELDTNKINGYFDYINCDNIGKILFFASYLYSNSNDEVEILEEEKKIPEKLEYWQGLDKVRNDCELDDLEYAIKYGNYNFEMFFNKINQIIDYLKSKGE